VSEGKNAGASRKKVSAIDDYAGGRLHFFDSTMRQLLRIDVGKRSEYGGREQVESLSGHRVL
jgi:hypothetical protein